jgi:ABC-type nitrate/sulfonate/bicarbonate transport system ATPase subunit
VVESLTVRDGSMAQPIYKLDRLTVGYGSRGEGRATPIRDLNLHLRDGEITCFLGKSGCGKTTLLKALGGFVVGDDTGGVLFRGRYLDGPTPEIVMIFQENNLFPWLTVRGNIAFGLDFQPRLKDRKDAIVDAMLATVGLAESARRYPHELSGGMRQRTAIARALVTDPQVLLLDEPFSALDVHLRRRMQTLLHQIWGETRKTMIMVTHNIEEAILVGHRVIVLGGTPAKMLIDRDTSAPSMKDRYAPAFLALQREIEAVIY